MRTVASLVVIAMCLCGCAAGSATAGYSARAASADDLGSSARQRVVDEAVERSRAYTDQRIAELRAELAR